MQIMVYYFGTCGDNTNAINNHNMFRIMVAKLTLTLETGPILQPRQRYLHDCEHLLNNKANVHPKNVNSQIVKVKSNKSINHI